MKQKNSLLIATSIVALTFFSCQKSNNDNNNNTQQVAPKAEDKATDLASPAAPEVKNIENKGKLTLVKAEEGHYLVMPATQEIAWSLDNNPIKSTCKKITTLKAEVAALESKKEEAIALSLSDSSSEGLVDELGQELEIKSNELEALKAEETLIKAQISKKTFLAGLETIKNDNADIKFEAIQPKKVIVSVQSSNKVTAEQHVSVANMKVHGSAQDLSTDAIVMEMGLSYDLLCTAKEAQKSVKTKAEKSVLFISFQ